MVTHPGQQRSGQGQAFSNLSLHQLHQKAVKPESLTQQVWDGTPNSAFLTSSEAVLMVLLPRPPHSVSRLPAPLYPTDSTAF